MRRAIIHAWTCLALGLALPAAAQDVTPAPVPAEQTAAAESEGADRS